MKKRGKFYRVSARCMGVVDGMEVLRPSSQSFKNYLFPMDCFFNVGDTMMMLDETKYTEWELGHMTNKMKIEGALKDKNYLLVKIIERMDQYILLEGTTSVKRINHRQMYARRIKYRTRDGKVYNSRSSLFFMIIGLVNEGQYEKGNVIYKGVA